MADPTLKGHKLLALMPWDPPKDYLSSLLRRFPCLQVAFHKTPVAATDYDEVPAEARREVTILVSVSCLPTLDQAPKLQYVQLMSAGAETILNLKLFTDTNIVFCTANGVHGPQISEWVISTFLAHQKQLPQYLEFQRKGHWQRADKREPTGISDDSVGLTVGILGYGGIGRQVARICKTMGMEIHAYTLHPRNTPESRHDRSYAPPGMGDPDGSFPSKWFAGGTKRELHEFLGSGLHVLLVSTPLTAKTKGLISQEEFKILGKNKTFVSNISRGAIVDTDALFDALENDVISGAAVDVTDPEPLPSCHKLWKAKNLIITPHVSGLSAGYLKRFLAILDLNLEKLSQGRPLMNEVSRREGY
ncbi:hypothetical protein QQS21_011030 [Conoideocrella luteorostrata]|uniref:D-isomer specific 2-hydroxyacid dehydrogenase NAD-binding domain-containing protein n=1 Tax=Conoideocrella luteorostrata TaxID=1105319 RepID=A0AAJ0CDV3_9HYPO|nr:hypothetical protein QQS21_011030 [Conoideocrella luteorostrata]